jgi:hypothetical protein
MDQNYFTRQLLVQTPNSKFQNSLRDLGNKTRKHDLTVLILCTLSKSHMKITAVPNR